MRLVEILLLSLLVTAAAGCNEDSAGGSGGNEHSAGYAANVTLIHSPFLVPDPEQPYCQGRGNPNVPVPVPEPATVLLLGAGISLLVYARKKKLV